jgi:hypothetical protein
MCVAGSATGITHPFVADATRHATIIEVFQHGLRVFTTAAEMIAKL